MVSFQHAVTLSCLVAGAYAVAPGHSIDLNAPFVGASHSWLLEQVLCACAGYLLKDFYIFEVCAPTCGSDIVPSFVPVCFWFGSAI
jgi:hypothetical protein